MSSAKILEKTLELYKASKDKDYILTEQDKASAKLASENSEASLRGAVIMAGMYDRDKIKTKKGVK
jgi:hypothetical protein